MYTFDSISVRSNADLSLVLGCSATKLKQSKSNVYNNWLLLYSDISESVTIPIGILRLVLNKLRKQEKYVSRTVPSTPTRFMDEISAFNICGANLCFWAAKASRTLNMLMQATICTTLNLSTNVGVRAWKIYRLILSRFLIWSWQRTQMSESRVRQATLIGGYAY